MFRFCLLLIFALICSPLAKYCHANDEQLKPALNSIASTQELTISECVGTKQRAYGAFVNAFVFDTEKKEKKVPVVGPGACFRFPEPVLAPLNIRYVEDTPDHAGLLLNQGVYDVKWSFYSSSNATVSLQLNNQNLFTLNKHFLSSSTSTFDQVVSQQTMLFAPLCSGNFLALVNVGDSLITLENLPGTRIESTSFVTKILIVRIG